MTNLNCTGILTMSSVIPHFVTTAVPHFVIPDTLLNILERACSLIIDKNIVSWNIVARWSKYYLDFKVALSPSKKNGVICLIERNIIMMKNVFYFVLNALFVLKIFKFLSRHFGHVEKATWFEK